MVKRNQELRLQGHETRGHCVATLTTGQEAWPMKQGAHAKKEIKGGKERVSLTLLTDARLRVKVLPKIPPEDIFPVIFLFLERGRERSADVRETPTGCLPRAPHRAGSRLQPRAGPTL